MTVISKNSNVMQNLAHLKEEKAKQASEEQDDSKKNFKPYIEYWTLSTMK